MLRFGLRWAPETLSARGCNSKSGTISNGEQVIPTGKLITIVDIQRWITKKHKVKGCYILATSISIMTIANVVEEATREGRDLSIPYWRMLKSEGFLKEKYSIG